MTPCGLPGKKRSLLFPAGVLLVFLFSAFLQPALPQAAEEAMLRVYDRQSGALYAEAPARVNSRLFFGWIHSLEKIPWNEYYHVDEKYNLVLDSITFPAFGAGIPEDKGRVCYVRDGLIHMEEIGQIFTELVWLNSRTATQDILLDGRPVTRGSDLPHHARIRLVIEKGETNGTP
ncbi:MAG: DUF1850 domain-containing protein [Desulfovibrio sp.]|jgi:hypothetical protein|nr:DUF1850 domain-containing protein [Desulfovibrio sp.]